MKYLFRILGLEDVAIESKSDPPERGTMSYNINDIDSFMPKKCRTSTFQKSFFIRTTRIWNLLITRLDLDNVTFENFKSVLYGYYSRVLAINYDPDSPRSFKSICLKCNTARFLDQEISCCM